MSNPGPEPQRISNLTAAGYLHDTYGWPLDRCARTLATATQIRPAVNAAPTEHGFVQVVRDGSDYIITDCGSRHHT